MTEWWEDEGVVVPEWRGAGYLKDMLDEATERNKTTLGAIKVPPCGICRYFVPVVNISERAVDHGFSACTGPRQERDFSCYEPKASVEDDGPSYRIIPSGGG